MVCCGQSKRNRTFTLRFNFAEVGVFLQNGRLLPHVNHLKENGEAAAAGANRLKG